MDSRAYARELASIIMDAAQRGLVPTEIRVGHRFKLASMTTAAGAQMLVGNLTASDMDRERWLCCEALMPELGICISFLRRMQRAEEWWEQGEIELRQLREKALARLADATGELPAAEQLMP